jgi:hypothetical protein
MAGNAISRRARLSAESPRFTDDTASRETGFSALPRSASAFEHGPQII